MEIAAARINMPPPPPLRCLPRVPLAVRFYYIQNSPSTNVPWNEMLAPPQGQYNICSFPHSSSASAPLTLNLSDSALRNAALLLRTNSRRRQSFRPARGLTACPRYATRQRAPALSSSSHTLSSISRHRRNLSFQSSPPDSIHASPLSAKDKEKRTLNNNTSENENTTTLTTTIRTKEEEGEEEEAGACDWVQCVVCEAWCAAGGALREGAWCCAQPHCRRSYVRQCGAQDPFLTVAHPSEPL